VTARLVTGGVRCSVQPVRSSPDSYPKNHGVDPVSQPELVKHVPDVRLYGSLAQDELTGNLGV
jgi:hypothetical protein